MIGLSTLFETLDFALLCFIEIKLFFSSKNSNPLESWVVKKSFLVSQKRWFFGWQVYDRVEYFFWNFGFCVVMFHWDQIIFFIINSNPLESWVVKKSFLVSQKRWFFGWQVYDRVEYFFWNFGFCVVMFHWDQIIFFIYKFQPVRKLSC